MRKKEIKGQSIKELSEAKNQTAQAIRRQARSGKMKARKIGKAWIVGADDRYLSAAQVAALWHMTPRRVQQLAKEGNIRARKISGTWVIDLKP